MTLKIGSLFSGAGGLDLGAEAAFDAETVWVCEFNKDAAKVLAARFPDAPNIGDITKVDWQQGLYDDGTQDMGSLEPVDILIGGFPCQDVSTAGLRAGLTDTSRSGLWQYFAEAIDALRPKFVVIENVRGLLSATANRDMEPGDDAVGDGAEGHILRAAGAVLGDLAGLGYDARWLTVSASWWGAPHRRDRVFMLAYPADIDADTVRAAIREFGASPVDQPLGDGEVLPTPSAGVFTRGSQHIMLPHIARLAVGDDTVPNPDLAGAPKAELLPTTRATSGRTQDDRFGPMLDDAVLYSVGDERSCLLPTPLADSAAHRGNDRSDEQLLPGVARGAVKNLLPTPGVSDEKSPTPRASVMTACEHGGGGPDLPTVIEARLFPTPCAHDASRELTPSEWHEGSQDLPSAVGGLDAVKLFPTPMTMDANKGKHPDEVTRYAGSGQPFVQLNDLATVYGEPRWHQYDAAIRRWEKLFRPAPYPVVPGQKGKPQLSPRFAEWMMGWPEGWCDVADLSRRAQLRICGNGVVPQQAAGALGWMLSELLNELEAAA